jgi:hypothetical protein
MIPCRPIKSTCLEFDPTEYITSTHNDDHFEFLLLYKIYYFFGEEGEELWINSITLLSLKSFT